MNEEAAPLQIAVVQLSGKVDNLTDRFDRLRDEIQSGDKQSSQALGFQEQQLLRESELRMNEDNRLRNEIQGAATRLDNDIRDLKEIMREQGEQIANLRVGLAQITLAGGAGGGVVLLLSQIAKAFGV